MLWIKTLFVIFTTIFSVKLLTSLARAVRLMRLLSKLPSPPGGHWLMGHQRQDPLGPGFKWLRNTVEAFPRVYVLWLGPLPLPTLVHPDTIKPLLTKSTGSVKSMMYNLLVDWLGEGLVVSDGAKWRRNRRLLTHSFHLDVLRTYMPVYNDCVEVLLGKMDQLAAKGQPMKVDHELGLCTFDIILRAACSRLSNCQIKEPVKDGELDILSATSTLTRIVQLRETGNALLLNPMAFRLSSMYQEWDRANKYIQAVSNELINQRKEDLMNRKMENGDALIKPRDFLDTILLARDADGTGLTVKEITDEVNTFLFAGHDTTSSTLTWILYVLAKYPEHQSRIREEVDELLGNRASARITSKDLSSLEYMSLVIKEVIRMYTPVVLPSRELTEPYEVDGVTLPVGTTVAVNLYQLHHNPTVWGDDHMEFRPSRFLPENFTKMDPFAYLPFSAGPRNCIGQQFASNQIKVLVGRILRRFRLSLVEGEAEPVPTLNLLVKPLNELLLKLEPRNNDDM